MASDGVSYGCDRPQIQLTAPDGTSRTIERDARFPVCYRCPEPYVLDAAYVRGRSILLLLRYGNPDFEVKCATDYVTPRHVAVAVRLPRARTRTRHR